MSTEAIFIGHNPVTLWESFADTLDPSEFENQSATHRDLGGFYRAEFLLNVRDRNRALEYLNNGPGREVKYMSHRGTVDWEGMVRAVVLDTGIAVVHNDLRNMANKVFVRYTPSGGGAVTRSGTVEHEVSQNRWGKKTWVLVGGEMSSGLADQRAQQFLNLSKWAAPKLKSLTLGGRMRDVLQLRFICIGWSQAMDFAVFNQTAVSGAADASVIVNDVVTDSDCGQFINTYEIDTNNSQIERDTNADRRPTSLLDAVCSVGDGQNNIWVWGMEADRHFYYRQGAQASLPASS